MFFIQEAYIPLNVKSIPLNVIVGNISDIFTKILILYTSTLVSISE